MSMAYTISEAERRVNNIKTCLDGRKIHSTILYYCRQELMQENYFHAVFEAAKSLAQQLRDMTGLKLDGAALIDKCFAENKPLIQINSLQTESERSEHKGFA